MKGDLSRLRVVRDVEIPRTSPPELADLRDAFWRDAELVAAVPKQAISLRDSREAQHLRIRSDLMIRLSQLIAARQLTQKAAAALFGVSQSRVSDLVRGRIDRFSVDTLIDMLGRAGVRVQVSTGKVA